MQQITSMEEFQDRCHVGTGFIYNDWPSNPNERLLHVASCPHLPTKANLTYDKYFAPNLHAALTWLLKERGTDWRPCGACTGHSTQ